MYGSVFVHQFGDVAELQSDFVGASEKRADLNFLEHATAERDASVGFREAQQTRRFILDELESGTADDEDSIIQATALLSVILKKIEKNVDDFESFEESVGVQLSDEMQNPTIDTVESSNRLSGAVSSIFDRIRARRNIGSSNSRMLSKLGDLFEKYGDEIDKVDPKEVQSLLHSIR